MELSNESQETQRVLNGFFQGTAQNDANRNRCERRKKCSIDVATL